MACEATSLELGAHVSALLVRIWSLECGESVAPNWLVLLGLPHPSDLGRRTSRKLDGLPGCEVRLWAFDEHQACAVDVCPGECGSSSLQSCLSGRMCPLQYHHHCTSSILWLGDLLFGLEAGTVGTGPLKENEREGKSKERR